MSYDISRYEVEKLDAYASIQPGFAFKSERFTDNLDDIPLVKGENVHQGYIDWPRAKHWPLDEYDSLSRYHLVAGDIVLAMDRPWVTAGLKWSYIKLHDPKSLLVQRVARIRAKGKLDQDYLRHIISSDYFANYLQPIVTGVNVPHISGKQIGDFRIPIPDLGVQRKIAAILSAYDDLIETNKRRIALLEKMAEEIYREWFVRMRFPNHQNTKIIKGVPEGWQRKKFGEFCMLKRGYDLPSDLVEEGPYPVVASTSVKTFHKHYMVEPPVITTGRSGSLGDVLMTHTKAWPLNTALYVREFFGNSPFLIFYTLKNMGLEKFNSGAGVPTLNRNHVNGIPMVIPEKNLQQRFDEIIEPIHKQADNFRQQNINLTKTRDLLLPRLISGKLSVADLDIQFPPSLCEETENVDRKERASREQAQPLAISQERSKP
ncbi:MAG: restriction endonuclease subunit S [Chromatiaceae bacterium]